MNLPVLSGVVFYISLMLFVAWWAARRVSNTTDFFVAGRKLGYFIATATLFATWFGAGSCMGVSGTVYSDGLMAVISDPFAAGLSLIIAGLFYVRLLRRLKLLTVTDVFGRCYSKNSEIFASVLMVPVYIGWLGSQMVAMGYILNAIAGIDSLTGIIIGGVIVLVYTLAGGMWAVAITDMIQMIVLVAGLLMIMPAVLTEVGGWGTLMSSTPKEMFRFYPADAGYGDWMSYFGQWALMGLGCVVGQDLIQRSLSCRNESVARSSALSAGALYYTIGLIPIVLGFAGRLIFKTIEDPELIMPALAMKFFSPLLLVIFMGALVSAIMSSADSSLLAATSLTTNNIILRLFPNVPEKRFLPLARWVTVILAVVSMGVALYVKEIYSLMVNSWATLFVGIFVPVTAALYWKKANTLAAWVSMVLGTGTWLGYIFVKGASLQEVSDPLFYTAAAYGGIVSLAGYLVVTLVRYKSIPAVKPVSELPEEQ